MATSGTLHTSIELDKKGSSKSQTNLAEPVGRKTIDTKSATKRNKILLAEDEKPLSRVLSLKLTKVGYEVDTAFNGEEALEMLKKGIYDLLLLDLVMPKMGGFEVLEEMKKQDINLKTVILSNLSQSEDKDKAKSLGALDFYTKSDTPITEIVSAIQKIFE